MLKRASISQIKSGEIRKADGYLVVTMRVYPRFLPKTLVDDYSKNLAPESALFARYREFKNQGLPQNEAFRRAGYEENFTLSPEGMNELKGLSEQSRTQNVFLICQCAKHEHCHVDLMLLLAERHFAAPIETLAYDYPRFRASL